MAGSPPDTGDDTGMPRWVKVSVIIALVLVLAFVILKLTGVGGEHGPGRHFGGAGGRNALVATPAVEHSMQRP